MNPMKRPSLNAIVLTQHRVYTRLAVLVAQLHGIQMNGNGMTAEG